MSGELALGWLDAVPGGWSVGRLRWLAQRFAGGTPNKDNDGYWTDGTIPWLNSGAVNQFTVTQPSAFITDEAYHNSSAKWIAEGALVMALAGQGRTKGMVAQLAIATTCNQSMAAIVPSGELNPRYLLWWLTSNYQNIRNMAGGDDRDGLNLELLGNIVCPLPAVPQQIAIAAFLDRETGKIDALVTEQRRLIELLKEKRQGVISHAVIRGLDPNAKMKFSGIEWLGAVPEHWDVVPLRWFASCKSGGGIAPELVQAAPDTVAMIPVVGGNGTMGFASVANVGHDVLAVGRVGALCGNVHKVLAPAWITDNALVVDADAKAFDYSYLALLLRARDLNRLAARTAQPLITGSQVQDQRLPKPPLAEQALIVSAIDRQTTKFDDLLREAERAIDVLSERRSALISAAVTGKIDVRGAMTAQEEAA